MTVYVDTSAFLAVLNVDDTHHRKAKAQWTDLLTSEAELVCSNYVLVETFALLQHRFGMEAVRVFQQDILPVLRVAWVEERTHDAGVGALLTASKKKLSLVDCVSFETMRRLEIKTAFAFDADFNAIGFQSIP